MNDRNGAADMTHKSIWERLGDGDDVSLFEPEYAEVVGAEFMRCRDVMFRINHTPPSDPSLSGLWAELLGVDGELDPSVRLLSPMQIDFGRRMRIAPNVFINHGFTAMSIGGITIEEGTFIGPNVSIVTDNHRLDDITILMPPRPRRPQGLDRRGRLHHARCERGGRRRHRRRSGGYQGRPGQHRSRRGPGTSDP